MKKIVIALALTQACALAFAQGAATHLCGGITQDEAQAMKAQARDHALMLTFAESNGAYLADVDVQIRDTRGVVVLTARCEGPIMLVDLPPGSWRVSASINGHTRQQTIATGRGRTARATLVWPAGTS